MELQSDTPFYFDFLPVQGGRIRSLCPKLSMSITLHGLLAVTISYLTDCPGDIASGGCIFCAGGNRGVGPHTRG
jgi:hypothetical protein